MINRNFQWRKCFVSIQLFKGVKSISEVTMTLAKISNWYLAETKIYKAIGKLFGICALSALLYSNVIN